MSAYRDLETGGARQLSAITNEFIGTFFITLALMAGVSGWGALSAAGMVAFWTWFESSGQYNAAITLSQCLSKNRSMALVAGLKCIGAQTVGAALAVVFSGVFMDDSASIPTGSLASGLAAFFLTLVLVYTYEVGNDRARSGLDVGLAYFSGLAAFGSTLGANASVLIGALLGNAALGGGLNIGMDLAWAVGAPCAAGVAFPYLSDLLLKIPRANELVGSFLFALLTFSIGFDTTFAVGISLHAVSNIFPGVYNPALSFAAWAKGGFQMGVIGDPILDTLAQIVGCALAAIVSSQVGTDGAVPAAFDVGVSTLLEAIFTIVLAFVYLAKAENLTKGLTYYAVTTACASSFNPALGLGAYLAGLAGFGSAPLALASLAAPLVAGVIAGVAHGKFPQLNELIGTALLFLFVGGTTGASDGLALGAAFVALHTIYAGGAFNPALTIANDGLNVNALLLQLGGATIGGLLAFYASAAGTPVSAGGLSDGGRSLVAEVLLAALLTKTYASSGNDYTSVGLSYFALLAAFYATAGSLANPALVFGGWVGNGLLGSGFDFDVAVLLGVLGHLAAPVVGAKFHKEILALPELLQIAKVGLAPDEFFASFLAVLTFAGVAKSSAASVELAYALVLMTLFNLYTTSTDIFPAISAYRHLGSGDVVGGLVGFGKKLAAQTLGAILAVLVAGWLFADGGRRLAHLVAPATATHAASARRLGIDLPDGLLDGVLWAMLFAWAFDVAKNTLNLGLAFFTAVTVFTGVTINGARSLAVALVSLVTGGGAGFATDAAWWIAFVAPLLGGVLAGRLAPLLGK